MGLLANIAASIVLVWSHLKLSMAIAMAAGLVVVVVSGRSTNRPTNLNMNSSQLEGIFHRHRQLARKSTRGRPSREQPFRNDPLNGAPETRQSATLALGLGRGRDPVVARRYLLSLEESGQHVRRVVVDVVQVAAVGCQAAAQQAGRQDPLLDALEEGDDDDDGDEVVEHLDGEPPGDEVALFHRID